MEELGLLQFFRENPSIPMFFVSSILRMNFEYVFQWLEEILALMKYPTRYGHSFKKCCGSFRWK
jgi:hypothetical protein